MGRLLRNTVDGAYQPPSLVGVIDHYNVDWIPHQNDPVKKASTLGLQYLTRNPLFAHYSISLKYNSQFLT